MVAAAPTVPRDPAGQDLPGVATQNVLGVRSPIAQWHQSAVSDSPGIARCPSDSGCQALWGRPGTSWMGWLEFADDSYYK